MKKLELYDVITMSDNSEYTIIKNLKYSNQMYYLLTPVDKEEEPDMKNLIIVKETIIGNEILLQEELDENKLKEISKLFLNTIKEEL